MVSLEKIAYLAGQEYALHRLKLAALPAAKFNPKLREFGNGIFLPKGFVQQGTKLPKLDGTIGPTSKQKWWFQDGHQYGTRTPKADLKVAPGTAMPNPPK